MVVQFKVSNSIFIDNNCVANFNLTNYYHQLTKLHQDKNSIALKHYETLPRMVRLRYKNEFTILIFNNRKIRVMGNINSRTHDELHEIVNSLLLHTVYLKHISDTVVFQLPYQISCYFFAKKYYKDNIIYESELFPAISIHEWAPTHVNLFHTGKVTVLGKNSIALVPTIYKWLLAHNL